MTTQENNALAELLADLLPGDAPSVSGRSIETILRAVRIHLGMDVAFVTEFIGRNRIFRQVDAAAWTPIAKGDAVPLENGYCQRVIDGRLPRLIPNTKLVPEAMALPETFAIPIGSHIGVPIRLSDGHLYGTFCCFGFAPDKSLNERDLNMMSAFCDLITCQLDHPPMPPRAGAEGMHP